MIDSHRSPLSVLASACLLTALSNNASAQASAPVPATDAEIVAMMKARVDIDKKGSAMVVGLIDPRGGSPID